MDSLACLWLSGSQQHLAFDGQRHLTAEALKRLENRVTAIEDNELRVALAGLGRDVASRQATRNSARRLP